MSWLTPWGRVPPRPFPSTPALPDHRLFGRLPPQPAAFPMGQVMSPPRLNKATPLSGDRMEWEGAPVQMASPPAFSITCGTSTEGGQPGAWGG